MPSSAKASAGKRARLIVNPRSGADRALELLPKVNARLRTVVSELDITITDQPDDAVRAAARAVIEGCDALYVAGGDGTLNLVLRGLASLPGGLERMPIGVLPFGTGNDFARAIGLSEDPESALEVLLAQEVGAVDIGMLNDRPFVNVSAGGFVADVSHAVTEGLKDATGKLAYVIGGARALLGAEPFSASLSVHGVPDAAKWSGQIDLQMFAVCNAQTIGGGYPIAPGASIDDGLLDVFLVRRMPTLEFIGVLQRIASGEHGDDERVLHFRAPEFELRFDRRVRVNTDGELFEVDACRYTIQHRGARFFRGPAV